jgi:predicted DNA-binding WGR domain protein
MSAVILHGFDPARRMSLFYLLDVQPDLFGQWSLIREWGDKGQPGDVLIRPYPTEREAQAALARQRRAKKREGYYLPGQLSSRLIIGNKPTSAKSRVKKGQFIRVGRATTPFVKSR